jgi:hypothetical protein
LSRGKGARQPLRQIDLGKGVSKFCRLLHAEPLGEITDDRLQPGHIAWPCGYDGIDLVEKNPNHEIEAKQHHRDPEDRRKPFRHPKASEPQSREALDHRFKQVPDEDADGKRHEEGAAIDEAGENDADGDDREPRVTERFPALRDFHCRPQSCGLPRV